ncbi:MAG: ribosome biogenesis GTP-binding protein YihA/YsxC [Gemmatimonadota bacterium]|nr:ribosome biogenesis GTP-binding protein YihA/YsxC [Gemmatimonadota bacterium]
MPSAAGPASTGGNPLVVRSLEFLGGMADPLGWRPPPELPEVAFAGRSNVGKSSLLNTLVGRRKLARVSNTPGRTREVNFFKVNDAFVLADLPGYGYARASKELRAAWRPLIEGYLERSPMLRGVVLLIDARHDPSPDDFAMREYLGDLGAPTLIALTKMDKLSTKEAAGRTQALARRFGVDEDQVVATSANTGRGRDELAETLVSLVEAPAWR